MKTANWLKAAPPPDPASNPIMKSQCIWTEGEGDHPDNPDSCYRNGKRHGPWELRYADGRVETGPYVNGERHGRWKWRFVDGTVVTGPFANNKQHGRWKWRWASGTVEYITFENGELVSRTNGPCK